MELIYYINASKEFNLIYKQLNHEKMKTLTLESIEADREKICLAVGKERRL